MSGVFIVPVTTLPSWMVTVASFLPLKWTAQGMRSVFLPDSLASLEQAGSWEHPMTAAVLGGWCVLGLVLCLVTFRWTDRRAGDRRPDVGAAAAPLGDAVRPGVPAGGGDGAVEYDAEPHRPAGGLGSGRGARRLVARLRQAPDRRRPENKPPRLRVPARRTGPVRANCVPGTESVRGCCWGCARSPSCCGGTGRR